MGRFTNTCRGLCLATVLITSFSISLEGFAQRIDVELTRRTAVDDPGYSLLPMTKKPAEAITLPAVDTTGASFLKVFYSWAVEGNEQITILVLPREEGQLLYADLNNDEDLSNDGAPMFFPYDQNELIYYLRANSSSSQRTGRFLQRIPQYAVDNSLESEIVDDSGNLRKEAMRPYAMYYPGFEGKNGTYFFDGYLDVSRGEVEIEGETYQIGIQDFNQNGIFTDEVDEINPRGYDRLLIDLGRDGMLSHFATTEMFKLTDVFKVGEKNYKLEEVDAYGERITLGQTSDPVTNYYVRSLAQANEEEGLIQKGSLDPSFWELTFSYLDSKVSPVQAYRGRYILLNFWGEWCAPCLAEMPALVQSRKKWPEEKLIIIGMLNTSDLEGATRMIEEKELNWPHVHTNANIVEQFKVNAYPTNILILPDGVTYIRTGQISTGFFDRYIE